MIKTKTVHSNQIEKVQKIYLPIKTQVWKRKTPKAIKKVVQNKILYIRHQHLKKNKTIRNNNKLLLVVKIYAAEHQNKNLLMYKKTNQSINQTKRATSKKAIWKVTNKNNSNKRKINNNLHNNKSINCYHKYNPCPK